ncbi:MAG: CoA-transferase, partial [Chloroflexota bacterium]
MSKVIGLAGAIAAIPDGSSIALGGNTLHRSPSAAVHELIRQGKRDLTLIKTAGAYDIDVLCGAGCVARLVVAYVGFENLQGMALRFRSAIETGRTRLEEHT